MQPNLPAIDVIAAHCDGCSGPCSRTIRTARSRTSDTYFRGRAMGSILSRNEPSDETGTLQTGRPAARCSRPEVGLLLPQDFAVCGFCGERVLTHSRAPASHSSRAPNGLTCVASDRLCFLFVAIT